MMFHYAFAFRGEAVRWVRRRDFYFDTKTQLWYFQGDNRKRKPNDPSSVTHECMERLNGAVAQVLGRHDEKSEMPLFPDYDVLWVGRMIKAAAIHFGWPKELDWNGAHCLRHGSIAEAVAAGGVAAGMRRGGHYTPGMVSGLYGLKSDERLKLLADRVNISKMRQATRRQRIAREQSGAKSSAAQTSSRGDEEESIQATPKRPKRPKVVKKATVSRKRVSKKSARRDTKKTRSPVKTRAKKNPAKITQRRKQTNTTRKRNT
jgi:hypothetical protein